VFDHALDGMFAGEVRHVHVFGPFEHRQIDHERKLMGVPAPLRKKPTMPQALYLRHHLENRFQGKA